MPTNNLAAVLAAAITLAGCGSAQGTAAAPDIGSVAAAAATLPGVSPARLRAGDELTSVDAALSDGAALPPDRFGPSVYDLQRSAEARRVTAKTAAAAPGRGPLHADEAVATGG